MAGILVFGACTLAIGILLLTVEVWGPAWLTAPMAEPKPAVRRLGRVIGVAIVAAGVAITFLPVSASVNYGSDIQDYFGQPAVVQAECGSAWQAMFTNEFYNFASIHDVYACGRGAFPHLWIAGGVAALGLAVAFWGASRGRLVRIVGAAVLGTVLIEVFGFIAFSVMFPGNMGGA